MPSLFSPVDVLSIAQQKALIDAGAASPEDFVGGRPRRTIQAPSYDNRPSSAPQDAADAQRITVEQLRAKQDQQLRELMRRRGEATRYAKGGPVLSQDEARSTMTSGALGALKRFFSALPEAASHWPKEAWDMVRMPADLVMGGSPEQLRFEEEQKYLNPGDIRPLMPATGADRFRAGSPEARANLISSIANPVANAVFAPVTTASALGRGGAEVLARAMQSEGPLASMLTSGLRPMGIIKNKGGNWPVGTFGSVEHALKSLKKGRTAEQHPLDKWIDGPLAKYVKRDMGTEGDPIRALAERGISHIPGDATQYSPKALTELRSKRIAVGMPEDNLGRTNLAKEWENIADSSIASDRLDAKYVDTFLGGSNTLQNPANAWIKDAPKSTILNRAHMFRLPETGLDHLTDELKNALGTDLPAHLRIDPKSLESGNFSVDAAVRRVNDINKWRADAIAEASQARANNVATPVYKEYPHSEATPNAKGLRWVEFKVDANDPKSVKAFQDAVRYEGETMGHSVGGYASKGSYGQGGLDAALNGRVKLYSLRDANGQPHATVEAAPTSGTIPITPQMREDYSYLRPHATHFNPDTGEDAFELVAPSQSILQIKGKSNRPPNTEYLPFVQDFVKSGQWSDVGDLQNTGLLKHPTRGYLTPQEAEYINPFAGDNLPPAGHEYAKGGSVRPKEIKTVADLQAIIRTYQPDADQTLNFANGGSVQQLRDTINYLKERHA